MKYTEDQYEAEVMKFKTEISVLKNKKRVWYNKFIYENEEYKNLLQKISNYEYQLAEFKKEHYSDFDVFTNNERQLSTRIDGQRMRA